LQAWVLYNATLSLEDVHVATGQNIENVNGNDPNHDLNDNLTLFTSLAGQTGSAAFLDFGSVQVVGGIDHSNGIDTAVYSGPSWNYVVEIGLASITVASLL